MAMLILGKSKKKDEPEDEETEELSETEELGQALLDAVEAGDPKGVYDAVCDIAIAHQGGDEEDEDY